MSKINFEKKTGRQTDQTAVGRKGGQAGRQTERWTYRQTDIQTEGRIDRYTQAYKHTDRRVGKQPKGRTNEWTDGQDTRLDSQTGRQMDERKDTADRQTV